MQHLRTKKRWRERIVINGKVKEITAKTQKDLKKKLADLDISSFDSMRFDRIAEEWWNVHSRTLAPNTLRGYKPAVERAMSFSCPIASVTMNDVQNLISSFNWAEKTAKTQLLIFNLIFKYSVQKGYIKYNPIRELQLPKNLVKTKISAPDDEDIERIKEYNGFLSDFVKIAIYTGLRKGELLALTQDDLDFEKREIRVTKSIYYVAGNPYVKTPKTKKGIRTVPIINAIYDTLKNINNYILFPDKNGNYMKEGCFASYWRRFRRESGTKCSLHQLRHLYATLLYENEHIQLKDAQYLLGHAQISTTADIYQDIRQGQKEKIKQAIMDMEM